MRGNQTFLQGLVHRSAAIAAFDRAFLRLANIKPLDEEAEDKTAADQRAKE